MNRLMGLLIAMTLAAGCACAEERGNMTMTKRPMTDTATMSASSGDIIRSSHLIGLTVKNRQDETLGEVQDAAVDTTNNAIAYVVVGVGGFLGIGEDYIAVPWNELQLHKGNNNQYQQVIWNKTKAEAERMQGFDKDHWPRSGRFLPVNMEHDMAVEMDEDMEPDMDQERMPNMLTMNCRLSDLRGMKVTIAGKTAASGERRMDFTPTPAEQVKVKSRTGTAEIDDVVIDAREGRLVYAILSVDDIPDLDFDTAIVPMRALSFSPQQKMARLNASTQQLAQAEFRRRDWQRLGQMTFAQRIHSAFNEEPYWQVYGYRDMGRGMNYDAWKPESIYNKLFNQRNVKTYEGRITKVDHFAPTAGAAEGTSIQIQANDGKTYTVHLAPDQYLTQQNLSLRQGSTVKVEGSEVTFDGKPAIIATSLEMNNRTYQLRDRQGKPQWDVEKFQKGETTPEMRDTTMPGRDMMENRNLK